MNKDGKLDIILTNTEPGHPVFLFLGVGDGTFTGPEYPDMPTGVSLAVGDINGDGNPDLVNADAYVVAGNGKGMFGKPVFYPTATGVNYPYQVLLADMLHSGSLDIVETNQPFVSVLLNNGKGQFEDGWALPTAPLGCAVAADFNGDGRPDVAAVSPSGATVFFGTGKASSPFTAGPQTPIAEPECLLADQLNLATGDFNNDGKPDLLVPLGTSPAAIAAYMGNGDGTFTLASSTPTTLGYIAVADFNRDGKLDYATTANLLALGNGDATFQTPAAFVTSLPPSVTFSSIAAGDLNHDGWPDIVLTDPLHDVIYVLLNNHRGGFIQTTVNLGITSGADGVQLADLNADGNLDAVAISYGGVLILLGNGKGGFTLQETLSGPYPVDPIEIPLVADVNGDGIPDIELAIPGSTAIYLGVGGGEYSAPFYLGTYPAPSVILALNLHGQSPAAGIPDLVFPDDTGYLDVLINETK